MVITRALILLVGLAGGSAVGIEDLMDCVYRREDELARRVRDAQFIAEYRYEEREPDGRVRVVETCTRRVSVRGDRQQVEFLVIASDGRVLAGRERERKIRELRNKGLVQDRTRMPLRRATRDEYRYKLAGKTTLAGRNAWLVEFVPVRRTGRHISGRAWLLPDFDCDIGRLEFRPERLPFAVRSIEMVLEYEPAGDRTLPGRFHLELQVLVRFLVTLVERYIRIEDRFTDYRFNAGLPDSLFD